MAIYAACVKLRNIFAALVKVGKAFVSQADFGDCFSLLAFALEVMFSESCMCSPQLAEEKRRDSHSDVELDLPGNPVASKTCRWLLPYARPAICKFQPAACC